MTSTVSESHLVDRAADLVGRLAESYIYAGRIPVSYSDHYSELHCVKPAFLIVFNRILEFKKYYHIIFCEGT